MHRLLNSEFIFFNQLLIPPWRGRLRVRSVPVSKRVKQAGGPCYPILNSQKRCQSRRFVVQKIINIPMPKMGNAFGSGTSALKNWIQSRIPTLCHGTVKRNSPDCPAYAEIFWACPGCSPNRGKPSPGVARISNTILHSASAAQAGSIRLAFSNKFQPRAGSKYTGFAFEFRLTKSQINQDSRTSLG